MTGIATFANSSISEESCDDIEPPNYQFIVKVDTRKTGTQVGKCYIKIKLLIEPFTFRKVRIYKDTITFACLECEKVGKFVYAHAEQISEDSYLLTKWPKFEDHICPPLKADFSKKNTG